MQPPTAFASISRKTSGDVPPKLIGASTTVIGSKLYLFGGRPIAEPRAVSDLYILDLVTFVWKTFPYTSRDNAPQARCFHSADSWNQRLVIFGGFGNNQHASRADDLCVLNDVQIFDTIHACWLPSSEVNNEAANSVPSPKPRHSHLSSVTSDRLFIIGGQDLRNIWLDDIYVYDLYRKGWVRQCCYPRHYGSYLSFATAEDQCVCLPAQSPTKASQPLQPPSNSPVLASIPSHSPPNPTQSSANSLQGPFQLPTSSTQMPTVSQTSNTAPKTAAHTPFKPDPSHNPRFSLNSRVDSTVPMHLSYSCQASEEFPCNIYLYSNYNFTDVKRKLEIFSPLPGDDFAILDESSVLGANATIPCLRFPTGAIVGTHLIVAGAYISPEVQCFSIWALDLHAMTWSPIDIGKDFSSKSWFQSCLWRDANKFLLFTSRDGDGRIGKDHKHRLSSWDHVIVIDLEAFGIYQPPPEELDTKLRELSLTALEEGIGSDYELICDDGRRIRCSRKLLEERWPWFRAELLSLIEKARLAMGIPSSSSQRSGGLSDAISREPDPRITSRAFHLSEPYPVTLALIQYFYTLSLLTQVQQAPAVLSRLLVLSTTYHIQRLQSLVKHAMHLALSKSTCKGVYEVATICGCQSLRIRALGALKEHKKPPQIQTTVDNADSSTESSEGSVSHKPATGRHNSAATTPSSQGSKVAINEYKSEPPKLGSSKSEPSTPQETLPPKSEPMKLRKKSSSSGLFGKVLRVATSRTDLSAPAAKKPSHKWRTGGGRHPLVVDHSAKAQKIKAIEAAMSGLSPENSESHEVSPVSDRDDQDQVHGQTFRDDELPAYQDLPSTQAGTRNPTANVPFQRSRGLPGATHTTHAPPKLRPVRPSLVNHLNRSVHAVSMSTDQDIRTIAEMLSPLLVEKSEPSIDPRNDDWAIGDDDDSIIEPTIYQGSDQLSPLSTKFNVSFR